MQNYLSGDIRDRIVDLREEKHMTREQLAEAVGISPATQGRIESGKTEKIGQDLLRRYADFFETSVDFLTGQTNYKTKRNYDIEELYLTEKSVEAICSGKLNMEVMNRLMENENFQKLTGQIYLYFTSAVSGPVAARNEIFRVVTEMIYGSKDHTAKQKKEMLEALDHQQMFPAGDYYYDHKTIYDRFSRILAEIRKDVEAENPLSPAATKEMVRAVQKELIKKKGVGGLKNASQEEIIEAMTSAFREKAQPGEEVLSDFRALAAKVFRDYDK